MEKTADILGTDQIWFVEPAFANLHDPIFNRILGDYDADEGRLLLDAEQEPLALAFHGIDGWTAGTFLFRNPSAVLIEKFERLPGEILQEDREIWEEAVRDYFSVRLMGEVPPGPEDLNPSRKKILTHLIEDIWGRGSGETCLDCCCGSGVGSLALREIGYAPLSYDNDESLLARGLFEKRLMPGETMWIDATVASRYIRPVQKGVAIMAGEINDFSQEMWERIIGELFASSRESIVTVGTEKEALLVQRWGENKGLRVVVTENTADPIYDRWICAAKSP